MNKEPIQTHMATLAYAEYLPRHTCDRVFSGNATKCAANTHIMPLVLSSVLVVCRSVMLLMHVRPEERSYVLFDGFACACVYDCV